MQCLPGSSQVAQWPYNPDTPMPCVSQQYLIDRCSGLWQWHHAIAKIDVRAETETYPSCPVMPRGPVTCLMTGFMSPLPDPWGTHSGGLTRPRKHAAVWGTSIVTRLFWPQTTAHNEIKSLIIPNKRFNFVTYLHNNLTNIIIRAHISSYVLTGNMTFHFLACCFKFFLASQSSRLSKSKFQKH